MNYPATFSYDPVGTVEANLAGALPTCVYDAWGDLSAQPMADSAPLAYNARGVVSVERDDGLPSAADQRPEIAEARWSLEKTLNHLSGPVDVAGNALTTYSFDLGPQRVCAKTADGVVSFAYDRIEEIYCQDQGDVRNVIRKVAPSIRREDVDDLVQEVFCQVCMAVHRPGYTPDNEKGLLAVVAARRAINHRNRQRHCPVVIAANLPEASDFHLQVPDGRTLAAVSEAEREEIYLLLWSQLAVLDGKERAVAEVYFANVDQFGARDTYCQLADLVSARTGKPENPVTIKSIWHAARRKLQEALTRAWPELFDSRTGETGT
jgi:RNA polymerase sigma factor (sigma-70 family)